MRRGTTPTLIFTLPFLTDNITKLNISFEQKGKLVLQKSISDVVKHDYNIELTLTEEDTLAFKQNDAISTTCDEPSYAFVQVRCQIEDEVYASNVAKIQVGRIIRDGVL